MWKYLLVFSQKTSSDLSGGDAKAAKINRQRRKHYVIEYIDKNKFLCLKILKGDERFAKELQDGN